MDVFGRTHTSGLGTMKWHMLDHVCDDIIRLGGLYLNDAGLYEASHNQFKRAYHSTSQRTRSAMEESVTLIGRYIAMDRGPSEKKRRTIDAGNGSKSPRGRHLDVVMKDTGCTARPYMSVSAKDFMACQVNGEGGPETK